MHVKEALIFRRSVLLSVIKLPVTFLSLTTTAPIQACVKHLQECHTVTSFRPSLHSNVIKSKGDFPSQLGRKADQVKATEYPLNPDTEMGEGRRVRVSVRRSMWVWERERVRETKRKREREKKHACSQTAKACCICQDSHRFQWQEANDGDLLSKASLSVQNL